MGLFRHSGVSVESWVEIERDTPVQYEVDHLNDRATLFFGQNANFVLHLGGENLRDVADLAARAHAELDAPQCGAAGERTTP